MEGKTIEKILEEQLDYIVRIHYWVRFFGVLVVIGLAGTCLAFCAAIGMI